MNTDHAPAAVDRSQAGANWDTGHIAARVKAAASWGAANHQRIISTEFGAARFRFPAARYQWIADARTALETNNIGWDLWDYTDLFGVTRLTGDTISDPGDGSVRLANLDGARAISSPRR
jgi:hypothetical protein